MPTKINYNQELNTEQLEVVSEANGPCLVLAGAGSGKTRTIVYRVAYLIENGVDPQNILLLTFTNKAAKEMTMRAAQLVGQDLSKIWGGTFHSIANRILRRYARKLGFESNFSILDAEDSKSLIKLCLKDISTPPGSRPPSAKVAGAIISFARNSDKEIEEVIRDRWPHLEEWIPLIEGVASKYSDRKKKANAMDFDDLLLELRRLLIENEDVGQRLAGNFQHVLVDEYQDTNTVQAQIVDLLSSVHKNLLLVGDDCQSIYSFRAADIENIRRFNQTYPKSKIYKLETNYRSSPEILDLANDVIVSNSNQFEKVLRAHKPSAELPSVAVAMSAIQEAMYITQSIQGLRNDGVAAEEIAVLFRAGSHSQSLEFELSKRGISYVFRGGVRFFERAHIKDVVSYLRIVNNYRDETAWLRTLNLLEGVGPATAIKITNMSRSFDSIGDIISANIDELLSVKARHGWLSQIEILKAIINVKSKSPSEQIQAVLKSTYRDYLQAEYPNAMDRIADLEQLAEFASAYEDLDAFLSEISLQEKFSADEDFSTEPPIVLSTIHQAKGLEWDTVFIMNMSDGSFPIRMAVEEGMLEEERRLFYVAATRAKRQLCISYPTQSKHGNMPQSPSQFITDLRIRVFEEQRLDYSGRPISINNISTQSLSNLNDSSDGGGLSYLPAIEEL